MADIIIENPNSLSPVEIKYEKTITPEFFKGLLFWQKISNTQNGAVVYGGEVAQKRSNGLEIIPWNKSGEL
ncbi:MAG: hypothetical protein LLG13_18775 [Bacteroidales bacterium]|nr:hypothetical protein [Bacteroidales bacterium]